MKKKILNSYQIIQKIRFLKKKRKKIVLCHGVFDLLHIGHINHFIKAKSYGDILIASLTADKFVNKGPGRPQFNEKFRAAALAALEDVDYVYINNAKTSIDVIKKIKPHFYCKGSEYKNSKLDITGEIINETRWVKKFKGRVVFTDEITFSSSSLINKKVLNKKQKGTINNIKKDYNFFKIKDLIDDFEKIKVLVIGETIIDQYVFCEALGKSGKEPVLVLRNIRNEQYLGGAAALALNVSSFTSSVTLFTMLGQNKEFYNFIKKKFTNKIKFDYLCKSQSPTILKRRFLDEVNKNKVFGVYNLNDQILDKSQESKVIFKLKKIIKKFDLVIVSDYGHGFITEKIAKLISQKSKYLALNAQVNAANVGYHTMRNYKNIDCVIINNTELRHEMRDKSLKIEILMKNLSKNLNINNLIVTQGSMGSILFNKKNNKFFYSDAYASKVVDKIGAGDAMLALIALSLKSKIKSNCSLLISSLAAAQSVENLGNKVQINKNKMLKNLESLLK